MQSKTQYDWFEIDAGMVSWLCSLYEWDLAPQPGAWAISGLLSNAESLQRLGLVEYQPGSPQSSTFPVRITQHGREYLEKCYPVELIIVLLHRGIFASHAQNAAGKLIRKLPLEVAPMFLVHKDLEIREVGQMIVERVNRV